MDSETSLHTRAVLGTSAIMVLLALGVALCAWTPSGAVGVVAVLTLMVLLRGSLPLATIIVAALLNGGIAWCAMAALSWGFLPLWIPAAHAFTAALSVIGMTVLADLGIALGFMAVAALASSLYASLVRRAQPLEADEEAPEDAAGEEVPEEGEETGHPHAMPYLVGEDRRAA